MKGLLCLKWNNHSTAFDKLLNQLHLKDIYSDGTIMCHGKFYPVHKFVLSTCSEYFEEIFNQCMQMECKHPFIIVKDIQPTQMEALLNYMYRGEVNVPQEMLPDLIKAAEVFKIKGLAVPDDDPVPSKSLPRDRKRRSLSPCPTSHIKKSKKLLTNFKNMDTKESDDLDIIASESDMNNKRVRNDSEDVTDHSGVKLPINESSKVEILNSDLQSGSDDIVKNEPPEPAASEGIFADTFQSPRIKEEPQQFSINENDDPQISNDGYDDMIPQSEWEDSQAYESEDFGEESSQMIGLNSPTDTVEEHIINQDNFLAASPQQSNYQCLHCNYQTSGLSIMKIHLRTHTGEKPFHCAYCPFKSSQKGNLTSHILIHTGEKHFQCKECSYKSSRNEVLKRHMLVHSGEKPFSCPHCSYRATQKHHLTSHLLKHSSN